MAVVEEIRALGRRAAPLPADFAHPDEVVALGQKAVEFLGGIDCLVNNAGISFAKPFLEVQPEQLDLLFHVNFYAQFLLTQQIARQMLDRGGAVCNITSIHGLQGASEYSLYAATKGAIIAFTRSIAVELAHRGIRVNAIAPGWVTVENYAKAIPNYDPRGRIAGCRADDPGRPAGQAARHRQTGGVPLLGRRRFHRRPDDRGRRRLLRPDVAQAGLPHRDGRSLGRRVRARNLAQVRQLLT